MSLISKKTLYEFREYFSAHSVIRQIEMSFESADVDRDEEYDSCESGQRRSLVDQYYHSLDLTDPDDARKLLAVFENVLGDLEEKISDYPDAYNSESLGRSFRILCRHLRKDGYQFREGRILPLGQAATALKLKAIATKVDAPYIRQQIQRMEAAIDGDPRLAIGTAKELVETTCKTILDERGKTTNPKWDLPELVKEVRKELRLVPEAVPDHAKAADTIRRLLSNLGTVVQAMAELRNSYGTGHGPHGRSRGLQARHARLAVGSSATLATFLFETHESQSRSD